MNIPHPNWTEIHALLENSKEDTIGGVTKVDLQKTAKIAQEHWAEIKKLKLREGLVLHLRPCEVVTWGLPFAIEVEDNNIFVLGKFLIDDSSLSKTVRLAAHLNNLKPVVHATIRYEAKVEATESAKIHMTAKWIENAANREVGMHFVLHGKTEFVHIYHNCEYRAKLKSSNNVVRKMGITMEYCNAGDLFGISKDLLHKNIHNILSIVKDMCIGLNTLEEKKIIHRDIKPENLFLIETEGKYNLRLGDLGNAVDIDREKVRLCKKGEYISGSMSYISPELYFGNNEKDRPNVLDRDKLIEMMCSNKIDVWSMGLTLFLVLMEDLPQFPQEVKLSRDPIINAETQKMISSYFDTILTPENCNQGLRDYDSVRNFLFKMVRQMVVLDQQTRISGSDLLKQFQEFESIAETSKIIPIVNIN